MTTATSQQVDRPRSVPPGPAGFLSGLSWPHVLRDQRLVDELLPARGERDPNTLVARQELPRFRPQGLRTRVHLLLEISLANPAVKATPLFQYQ
jgi:hypothetical protein